MKDFAGMEYRDILGRDWSGLLNSARLINSGLPGEAAGMSAELYHEPSKRWFVQNSYSYEDQQVGITGQVLTLHDITQRKNMTEALEITNREIENNRSKLENALAEIDDLIQQVTNKRDFSVRFANPNLRPCREVMNCTKTECPCHENDGQRCWQTAGTFCGGKVQGAFTDKFGNCSECPTYKLATSDPIYQIGESFNNMMHILSVQHGELEQAYNDLKVAQSQVTQQEKMASIGQLAAGVAHEINNPTGFIMSNLGSLQKYADKLTEFIRIQSEAVHELAAPLSPPLSKGDAKEGRGPETILRDLESRRKALKVDFISDDLRSLVKESLDGADRIKKIVQDLKSFSRVDETEQKPADINAGIESTINIVWNELKYKATLKKEYGDIPQITCNPGQLNQVFMNILVNAAHAIEKQGEIGVRTWAENNAINVSITDTGSGIPKDKINRIFEPFFTTKEVGKGTGLGLSIAYDIVKKHKGVIGVVSEVGKGTTFTVTIPMGEQGAGGAAL
jgi:two-component system NtrC family sensor kinase